MRAVSSYLENNRQNTTISLAYFCLSDEGLAATAKFVRDNPFVKHLDLRGNDIQARGVTSLANGMKTNRSLRSVNLKWNSIGKDNSGVAALCEVLKGNLTIKLVDLRNNHIDSEGARHIAEMLKTNSTITHLDLSWNDLRGEGGVALLDGLKRNQSLVDFQLSGSKAGEEVLHEVAFLLRRNRAKARREAEELSAGAPAAAPAADAPPANAQGYLAAGNYVIPDDAAAAAAVANAAPPEFRPRTVQQDRSIMLRIMMKEREEPLPEGKLFFQEIAEHIDGLLLECNKHKQGKDDGEERERQSTSGFQQREERYLKELLGVEESIKTALADSAGLEVDIERQRWELKEVIEEDKREKREIVLSKERGDLEEQQLEKELAQQIYEKRTSQDKMVLNNNDLQLLEEENERLKVHVENFKRDMATVLGGHDVSEGLI